MPGYAYLLAALYKIFGPNPFVPGLVQAAADAGVALLIYLICIRVFGSVGSTFATGARLIGLIAAVGWAFFVPAEAYSVILMPTALFVLVFWFVVWRIVRSDAALSATECLVLSLLIGFTATAVATILAIVPLIFAALLFRLKNESAFWRILTVRIACLVAGLVLGTSPCWIHNYFIAKDPVALSAHSGINFWIGNNPEANGYPRFPPGLRSGQAAMLQDSITQAEAAVGRPLKHAEVSAYWSNKAKAYLTGHFSDWLQLLGRKLRNFWNAFQYDDLSIITSLRDQNVILPGIYFGVVATFAIPGIFFGWKLASQSRWIFAAICLSMFALLSVFITERYRLVAVWQAFLAKQIRTIVVYLVLLAAATIAIAWPQRDPSLFALDAYNSGWQALESNNLDLAAKKLALAYAYVPDNSETLFAIGNLRLAQNDRASARSFYRVVLNLDPKHKGAFNNLGVIALDEQQYAEAEKWFRRAQDVDPRNAKTHFLLAKTLFAENDRQAARIEIDIAIGLDPDQPEFAALKERITEN
ncbi:MAG: hypothetical protein DMF73_20735 [Acidobacteria bacterium]|nr:MAG: hypothetical protein DMF73_20735 [Acidobacteriota bacterium]